MRKSAAIVVSLGLIAALSACASGPVTGSACADSGNAALVQAAGGFGSDPEASFPFPLVSTSASVAVVADGDGVRMPQGGTAQAVMSLYDGETGGPLLDGASGQALVGLPFLLPTAPGYQFPFTSLLACASAGSRVAVEGPAGVLLTDEIAQSIQLDPGSELVIVTDILSVSLGRADGADQVAQSDLPAVVTAPSGQPGFTFPDSPAPSEKRVALLKRGTGPAVAEGDAVVLHFTSIAWQASAVSGSSWPGGTPKVILLDGKDDSVLPGVVKDALVNQPIGSQVIVVVPGESAVVYVVDILGVFEQ